MNRKDLELTGDLERISSTPSSQVYAVMSEEGNTKLQQVDEDEVEEITMSQARDSAEYTDEFDRLYKDEAERFVVVYDPDKTGGKIISTLLDKLLK